MKPLIALLQFTTILPLGTPSDFDAFARHSWLYPAAGYVLGSLCAVPALLAWAFGFDNSLLVAAVTLALAVFLSGANHFDGLLDFGDGLMAHGSREKRIQAMTDRTTGAGALAVGMLTLLVSFAALASLPPVWIAAAVLTAEVGGKMVMGLFSALGKPFHEGIQKYIYDCSKRRFAFYTVLLALPLVLLPWGWVAAAGLCAAGLLFIGLWLLARRLFGGVNGDVTGAGNEFGRMVVLVVFALLV